MNVLIAATNGLSLQNGFLLPACLLAVVFGFLGRI